MDILLLTGQVLFGGFFVIAGVMHVTKHKDMARQARAKGVPLPEASVIVSGIIILLAGLGVIFSMYLALSLLVISAFIIVITPAMHSFWSETDKNTKTIHTRMFLKNVALLGAALALLATIGQVTTVASLFTL